MKKPLCIISCPIDTYSGYGTRSRDFVKSLIELKKEEWDIKIISQLWGNTNLFFIKNNPEWSFLNDYILISPLDSQPDIWIQITVCNEFTKHGKYNIGITAGIETDKCSPTWIDGCNNMDLILVSSKHSYNVLKSAKNGDKKIETPIEVLFEGIDIKEFYIKEKVNTIPELDNIKNDFCFLISGMWCNGPMGHDRKNIPFTIKLFLEIFKNKVKKPALVLKITKGIEGYSDIENIKTEVEYIIDSIDSNNIPDIYLINGDINMNDLYNHPKIKSMITLTHGEGFGRHLAEFSLVSKPIIAPRWSGHLDFLKEEFVCLINGTLNNIHPVNRMQDIIDDDSKWFFPDINHFRYYLVDIYENYKNYTDKSKRQAYFFKSNFSLDKMTELLDKYIKEHFKVTIEKKINF